jgi:hypothetical protein
MRVFKSKPFERFARQSGIDDSSLLDAVHRAERGQIDADLGGGVLKQRIARPGEGKSGGIRSIILYKAADRAFFVRGFEKSRMSNISDKDLRVLKQSASVVLNLTPAQLAATLKAGAYIEIVDEGATNA